MSIKKHAAAVVCGLALAATTLAPAAAFAVGNTGSTDVTVQVAKGGEHNDEDQLAFEVPTKIPFAASADGTLVGPSADETKIVNKSVFPIHVTDMSVSTDDTSWHLVANASESSEANALSFKLNDVSAAAHTDLSTSTSWNMGHAGSATDSIKVASAGKVANVNLDLSQPQHAATVTWKLAAGAAK